MAGAAAGGSRDDFLRTAARAGSSATRAATSLPSDQPDFPTATKFVNALLKNGVDVQRATGSFQVAGKTYPAGSYVVKTAQAFRPHVLDMFEPQDHPNDFPYPGGPPTPPYDNAGYTLAFQMGVQFDRILDGFDGPFETIEVLTSRRRRAASPAFGWRRLAAQPRDQRRVHRDQPPDEGGCRRVLDGAAVRGARGRYVLHSIIGQGP